MSNPNSPEYVAPKVIASRYGVSARSVANWVSSGKLPAIRVGKQIRIRLQDAIAVFERPAA